MIRLDSPVYLSGFRDLEQLGLLDRLVFSDAPRKEIGKEDEMKRKRRGRGKEEERTKKGRGNEEELNRKGR